MSDYIIDLKAELAHPDFALVMDYADQNLDAERMAEVQQRMETDEEFRRYAAPIIAVWTVRPQLPVPVAPRAELEAAWDNFTLRAGFVHQRARNWRRRGLWLLALLLLAGAATVGVSQVTRARAARERALYKEVATGGQAITLAPGTAVEVAQGARVRVAAPQTPGAVDTIRVLGSAMLRIVRDTPNDILNASAAQLTVKTLATVDVSDSLLVIRALTDTTPVAIYVANADTAASPMTRRSGADSVRGPVALKPSVTVIPGRPMVMSDTSAVVVGDPVPGQPKKKTRHYWSKSVLYLVAIVLSEVLIR